MKLERVADLDVAAASGVVDVAGELWVIADDELDLRIYRRDGRPLRRVTLFPGPLPEEHDARKAQKPDLEALALLPDGSVLALGSGSRPSRCRGARVRGEHVRLLELAPLYERLLVELPELNIEGAAVCGPTLRLFSRGNGPSAVNAAIDLALSPILEDDRGRPWGQALLVDITPIELPDFAGHGLGITGVTPLGGERVLFAAAAEDSKDTYADGEVKGSVVGLLDGVEVKWFEPAGPMKIEGLTRAGDQLMLVSDADDRRAAAGLYRAPWPLPG